MIIQKIYIGYYISFVPGLTLDSADTGKPSKLPNRTAGHTHMSR